MRRTQNRDLVLKAAMMSLYQRETSDEPVVLRSDRGTQFTRGERQTFLQDHQLIWRVSAVGHCADNATAAGSSAC